MLNQVLRIVCRRKALLVTLLLASLIPLVSAQHATEDEQNAWLVAYKDWLRNVTPQQLEKVNDPLPALRELYKEHLKATGLTDAQVEQRWASINQQAAKDMEARRLQTNLRYAAGWYEGEPPSGALRDFVQGRVPGRAVDCGMGSGRNAVLLASMGWQVTGMDLSDTAVQQARSLASKAGVRLQAVQSTYRDFDWGKDRWDLIVNVDAQDGFGAPNWPASSTFFSAPLVGALKPGGVLYIEAHVNVDGPNRLDGVGKLFPSLRVLKEEVVSDPLWEEHSKSAGSQRWKWPGTSKIAVFIAQKPFAKRP